MDFSLILRLICVAAVSGVIGGKELDEGCVDALTFGGARIKPRVIHVYRPGHLYSPGFVDGDLYPDNLLCHYQLTAPPGLHVRLHFNTLDIEVTDMCFADSLKIRDLQGGRVMVAAMLCGNVTTPDYVSMTKNGLYLEFKTDGLAGRKGFNITYSLQTSDRVCSSRQKQCRNRNCVDSHVVCDGNDDCGDGTDEESCPDRVLPVSECGRPEIDPVSFGDFDRVVGGRGAVHGSWPWMASLQEAVVTPTCHTCGGTLLDAQWVLTAAHCFLDPMMYDPKNIRIHVGNYRKYERADSEQIRYAKRIVIYDDRKPETLGLDASGWDRANDMALIQLNAPVEFSKYVKPICLPESLRKLNITSNCYATGWGYTRGSGNEYLLKQAYHPVQPDAVCSRLRGEDFVPSNMICAGSMAPLNGICQGDSGGPLACKESDGRWSIEGVTSFSTDTNSVGELEYPGSGGLCGVPGRPSVFNKVAVKTSWIRKIINKYS